MKLLLQYCPFFFLLLLLLGCDDPASGNTTLYSPGFLSERSPYVLDGTVIDDSGLPVGGADIHYIFKMSIPFSAKSAARVRPMPSTTISFGIPRDGKTTLRVYRLGTRELIKTLIDTVLHSGSYTRSFDSGNISNGIYIFQLICVDYISEKLMILLNDDISMLIKTTPITKTDLTGKFRIPYSLFGLDEEFSMSSDIDPILIGVSKVDSIGIVIYRSDKKYLLQWITINKNNSQEQTFTLH